MRASSAGVCQVIFGANTDVARLRDSYRWFIVPTVNPDGYEYSRTVVSNIVNMVTQLDIPNNNTVNSVHCFKHMLKTGLLSSTFHELNP